MRVDRRIILIAVGLLLGAFAVMLVNIHVKQEKERVRKELEEELKQRIKNLVPVLIAKRNISIGEYITSEMVEMKLVPQKYLLPRAVSSIERISGMRVIAPIAKGEQITLSKLMREDVLKTRSLAMATPIGKRAITISVDDISGLAGMIKPGDYVDVLAIINVPTQVGNKQVNQLVTLPLFQNVLVLAVGQSLVFPKEERRRLSFLERITGEKKEEKKRHKGPLLVTLALKPEEASLLSFISEQAKIRLILRSPADAEVKMIPPVNWNTFFEYINKIMGYEEIPQKKETVKEEKKIVPKPSRKVEIYRGFKRELIGIK